MPLAIAATNTPPPPYTLRPGIPPVTILLTIDDDIKNCMDGFGKVQAQIENMLLKVSSYREELDKVCNTCCLVKNLLTPIQKPETLA